MMFPKKTGQFLSAIMLVLSLLVVNFAPGLAVQVGNDEVNFLGVLYDFPTAGQSTWYYQVISGAQPAISHVSFELNLECLSVDDAGTWDGSDFSSLNSGGGSPSIVSPDPTTGVTGIKFDEGFEEGETRYYYFTVNGNYAPDDNVVVASKGGNDFDTALITGPSGVCEVYVPPNPGIDIEKYINGDDADVSPGLEVIEGDDLTFDFVVTNTGNVTLTNVEVVDDVFGAICSFASLSPGESGTCSIGQVAVLGLHTNTATATGSHNSTTVSDSDPANYTGAPRFIPNPLIDIEKYINGEDADESLGVILIEGDQIVFTFVVVNIGNVTLSDVQVVDDVLGPICSFPSLAVGESQSCTFVILAERGQHVNIGAATGTYNDTEVTDSDPAYYAAKPRSEPKPGLKIKKAVNGMDADEAPGISVPAGSTVVFTYNVLNTGNVTLENIQVADNMLGMICLIASLAPGQSVTCQKTATAIAGQYMNVGKAVTWYGGTPQTGGIKVASNDYAHYFGVTAP